MNMHNALNIPETGPPLTEVELELCKKFLDDTDLLNGFIIKYREGDTETRYWFLQNLQPLSREVHTDANARKVVKILADRGIIEARLLLKTKKA